MTARRRPWWKPRRSRRSQRWALVVVVLALGLAAWALSRAYDRLVAYPERPGTGSAELIEFEVPRGASFPQVLDLLVEHEVIAEEESGYFKLFVLQQGAARKTTAGPHRFAGNMTPTQILEELQRRQKAEELSVTIPEGKNILEVAQIIAEAGLCDVESLEAAMRDRALLDELGIVGPTAEGYLFPDTYKFAAKATPAQVLTRLVSRHRKVFSDLRRRYRTEARQLDKQLGWGDHEVVVLASIVEKETAARHERPLIAGVFLNRLRFSSFKPKLLQTDPTIVYGCVVPTDKSAACQKFEGRIRRIHLRDKDNPYSTYAHEGLPPGPISNPGRAALEAVLSPKKSRYLYFVSRNDGTHEFSKTVAEHEKWVEIYQRQGKVGQ
ncbi:MAG: endolytic transglycosylase MltG [Deltaproteobacteria bacterium]|nr:endolytic transglycosylase MltG [Deltaproteobacteria bacterium]